MRRFARYSLARERIASDLAACEKAARSIHSRKGSFAQRASNENIWMFSTKSTSVHRSRAMLTARKRPEMPENSGLLSPHACCLHETLLRSLSMCRSLSIRVNSYSRECRVARFFPQHLCFHTLYLLFIHLEPLFATYKADKYKLHVLSTCTRVYTLRDTSSILVSSYPRLASLSRESRGLYYESNSYYVRTEPRQSKWILTCSFEEHDAHDARCVCVCVCVIRKQ